MVGVRAEEERLRRDVDHRARGRDVWRARERSAIRRRRRQERRSIGGLVLEHSKALSLLLGRFDELKLATPVVETRSRNGSDDGRRATGVEVVEHG